MPDVWFWSPNKLSETLEFSTDIRISRSSEKRDSYKDATQRFVFEHNVDASTGERMFEIFRLSATGTFLVPEWAVATIIRSVSILAGSTTLQVIDGSVYKVGGQIFLGNSKAIWETVNVLAINGNELTVDPIVNSYQGSQNLGIFVMPLVTCLIPSGVDFRSIYRRSVITVEFISIDTIDLAENPYPEFKNLPLITDGRNTFSPLVNSINQRSNLVDSGFGHYAIIPTEDFTRRNSQLSFFDNDYISRLNRRKFFHFLRGRDGEFWLRTGQRDLLLLSPFSASSLTLSVRPVAQASEMVGRNILVKEGQNSVAREVISAIDVSENQQNIEINPTGFTGSTQAAIMFLHKSRLDSDEINISYRFTPSGLKASTLINTVEVP